ncbi:MAG: YwaF family protein [Lachnospiraceae bacterium]|nr:YwaF family protein [Lachnospiraceae bacterium]
MFSEGHLIWIGLSILMIIIGLAACRIRRPSLRSLMKSALYIGIASEVIKVFSVAQIVPVADTVIREEGGRITVDYVVSAGYTPYIAMEHMPLELCSLYLVFMLLCIALRDGGWKRGLYAVMYASGTIGGLMGIFFASISNDFSTVAQYFASARVWQYFIYHSMIVVVSLYLGSSDEAALRFADHKKAVIGLVLLDIPTFYLNSVLSSEIYVNDKLVGVSHRINYFSSYVSPFGMNSPDKRAWLIYLVIRAVLAYLFIIAAFSVCGIRERLRRRQKDNV